MAKTLLLADDSVTIQKVVGISFANEDVKIVTVDNGDDALARAREVRPDLVLADVVMPGKNGYEVCETLKSDPQLCHIPVLLLTGTFEAFDEERARRARADGHITKPFEAQSLVDKVNELLARARQRPAAPAPPPAVSPPAPAPRPIPALLPTPASAPAQVHARPEPGTSDSGFDFFDDDFGAASPDLAEAEPPATTAFELDAGESGFDFAPLVEEPASPGARPSEAPTVLAPPPPAEPEPPADQTMLMRQSEPQEDWPSGADLDAAFDDEDLSAEPASQDPDADVDDLDFGFDEPRASEGSLDPLADLDAPLTARESLLDPDLGRDFAVSSSDLADPPAAEPEEALPEALPPPAQPQPAPDLTPLMRERVHESLEKIAWEAFADLPDTIVRQALAKIEEIAWEVIPQMAEALIREEIRRMKGETG